ncbi:MAG TPA: class I SAM-dependent methyltransferase [Methylomirabilota bacterium]|nr:class I SAM-dependent methyltransferase [Methylomirabilota bacterium]
MEVGVYRGLTLLTVAAANPDLTCHGVDDFSQFDPAGENAAVVTGCIEGHGLRNAHLHDADFEVFFHNGGPPAPISVYFVDGPHDYRSQFMMLSLAVPFFAPQAVVVIDDSNYGHVRQATSDFLRLNPDFRLLFQAYTPSHPVDSGAPHDWWNGINILCRGFSGLLAPDLPPISSVTLAALRRDHTIHAHPHGEHAPAALRLWGGLRSGSRVALRQAMGSFTMQSVLATVLDRIRRRPTAADAPPATLAISDPGFPIEWNSACRT